MIKTLNFVYGVRMPIIAYLTIDSICSWLCAWAITFSKPTKDLRSYVCRWGWRALEARGGAGGWHEWTRKKKVKNSSGKSYGQFQA